MTDEGKRDHFSPPEQTNNLPEVVTTPEGFKINGRNETSLIRSLSTLNGTPIAQLERRMCPRIGTYGVITEAGFLGMDESLTDVLADDNETVLGMGLTHQELADFLHTFDRAPGKMDGFSANYDIVKYKGERFAHVATVWKGFKESPFNDGVQTDTDHTVISLKTGAGISYSGLLPEMIGRYGFYEGRGTGYRLDPKRVAEVAGFIPPSLDDPVVQLVQNPNAYVEITTREQLARVSNLDSTRVDVLSCQNYRIVPEDLDALFEFCRTFKRSPFAGEREEPEAQRARRERIAAHVDMRRLAPRPYQMGIYDCTFLTETVPLDFPQFEQAVLNGIERLYLPRGREESMTVNQFLEQVLEGASKNDSPHKAYYEGLLRKLPADPQTVLQIHKAEKSLYNKQLTEKLIQPDVAKREQEVDKMLAQLPDNVDEQARVAIETLIRYQQRDYLETKIDIGEFVGRLITKAKDLKSGERLTESDVLNEYAGLCAPSFREFLSHPIVRKAFSNPPYVYLNLNEVNLLPEIEVPDRDSTKKVHVLTIGEETYWIDKRWIFKGDRGPGSKQLSLDSNGSVSLAERTVR